ncbi:hypothetical protein [Chryseobacterium sp.]|uniref:hypothetical protein n=1 Tax=Chryseobacterium sp. TaxID=1871047 RepID=UPI0025C05203|nr:hypothetical protein [Chryseobacterium sp.]MBV8327246.1 hypothetical protein [Chryseobacterium sp.]
MQTHHLYEPITNRPGIQKSGLFYRVPGVMHDFNLNVYPVHHYSFLSSGIPKYP